MADKLRIRNLGILAHVDAGKTTLTENMLFLSGSTKAIGNVNKGTSLSDRLEVEKRRGISVRAASLSFLWKGVRINLIDTPGHVDFAAEVERSLRVLDGAVLVLSAVEGMQASTESVWTALEASNIPVVLFINKIDRMGADTAAVLASLRKGFSPRMVLLNQPENEGQTDASVAELSDDLQADLAEMVAEQDDALLERYLDGEELDRETVGEVLARCARERGLFPVLCGSAKNGSGIQPLLDTIVTCLPDAETDTEQPVSGVVFRIDHDARLGRIAGVRLYAGILKNRSAVLNSTADREEKVTQIKASLLNRYEDSGILAAGDIGFLCGMPEAQIGDVLGDPERVPGNCALTAPLLSVQVRPQDDADHFRLAEGLQQLSSEDPHLNFRWFNDERELHVDIMGAVQTEILTEILMTRFGIAAVLSDPTVIYKETPARTGYGTDSYTMPKPCWAIVTYLLEPGERGSGVVYSSAVSVDRIKRRFQNEIAQAMPEALEQGIKGWEVTDLRITLTDGEDHVLHSRSGNFKLATNIAIMKGLTETDTRLLEPFLAFRISAAEEFYGKVTTDISNMRGSFEPAEMAAGKFVLRGRFPLATSMDYSIRLSSLTGGKAGFSVDVDGYEECPDDLGIMRKYSGICPLDRSKYILKMRGAITAATTT